MRGNGFGNGNRVRTPKTLQCRPVAYSNRGSPTHDRRQKIVERKPSFPISYGGDTTKDRNTVGYPRMGESNEIRSDRRPFSTTPETENAATLFSSSSSSTTVRNDSQSPLPKDWQQFVDQMSGRAYFYNHKTKVTTWTRPSATKDVARETQSTASLFGNSLASHRQPEMPVISATAPMTISSPKRRKKKVPAAPSLNTLFSTHSNSTKSTTNTPGHFPSKTETKPSVKRRESMRTEPPSASALPQAR